MRIVDSSTAARSNLPGETEVTWQPSLGVDMCDCARSPRIIGGRQGPLQGHSCGTRRRTAVSAEGIVRRASHCEPRAARQPSTTGLTKAPCLAFKMSPRAGTTEINAAKAQLNIPAHERSDSHRQRRRKYRSLLLRRALCGGRGSRTALVLLVFAGYAGWPVPEPNEPHCLSKAKHYWDPAWIEEDFSSIRPIRIGAFTPPAAG